MPIIKFRCGLEIDTLFTKTPSGFDVTVGDETLGYQSDGLLIPRNLALHVSAVETPFDIVSGLE